MTQLSSNKIRVIILLISSEKEGDFSRRESIIICNSGFSESSFWVCASICESYPPEDGKKAGCNGENSYNLPKQLKLASSSFGLKSIVL